MPLDWEVIEYALGDMAHEMTEEEIENWVQMIIPWYDGSLTSIKGGLNTTTEFENAAGYGPVVLELELLGEYAEVSDVHVFVRDAKEAKLIAMHKR